MWVHPDIIKDQQWTTVNRKKIRSRGKANCHVVSVSSKETETNMASLTDSEEEKSAFIAGPEAQPISTTRSGKQYLKDYDKAAANASRTTGEVADQLLKKIKEARFNKSLRQDHVEGPSTPFNFDVLAQLANIPARITLYELLRLSKTTREALREALADSEAFITQVPAVADEEANHQCLQCDNKTMPAQSITFTPKDMQVKGKHNRPLYFTGYIGSSEVDRFQVDPGSALSIMPRRVM